MKKMMKKVLSGILSAALILGGMNVVSFEAKAADDHTAFLMFSDRDWAYGNWDSTLESATTSVTGDGSYSVTLNASEVGGTEAGANGAMVFCVDIVAAQADMEEGKTYEVSDVEVLADGEAVDVDASKIVTGDIEENGNFRIEIYNEYGSTATDSPIDQNALNFKDTLTVNFTLTTVDMPAEDAAATATTEQTAFLMFTDRDWAYGNWDATLESATTTVAGDGSYSVTLNTADMAADQVKDTGANGAMVFCVDVVNLGASVTDISAIQVSDLEILADGEAVTLDASKVVTGDIEENGNFRIEIYNEYGDTAADSPIDQTALTFKDTLTVNFTLSGITYGEAAVTETVEEAAAVEAVDLNGTYHAYIGLQSPTYTFRNAFDDETYGRDTEYFNQMTGWDNNDAVTKPGTFVDAEITGNGTYTVSANGLDMTGEFDSQDHFNLIFLSTDIPNSGEITISDIKLNIDGRDVAINPILSEDSVNYVNMTIQNIWNENADIQTIGYYNVPPTDVTITFTVSGFAYDNTNATVEEAATETTPAATETTEAATTSNSNTVVVVVVIIIVIVAIVVIVLVMNSKKKKDNK